MLHYISSPIHLDQAYVLKTAVENAYHSVLSVALDVIHLSKVANVEHKSHEISLLRMVLELFKLIAAIWSSFIRGENTPPIKMGFLFT